MGLAGPKKRTKISNDPNNTKWFKSTDSFGHRMLTSQGWKPGEYLGAKDANHASHYTAANASHIRVLLKDDNLGLGAKIGNQNAETFGLSQFSGLLGRLNGKSDESLKKEADSRRDVELRLYQGRKYGTMNFISAGFLVGDKIEARQDWGGVDPKKQRPSVVKEEISSSTAAESTERSTSSKKRKRDRDAVEAGAGADADSALTKDKKSKHKKSKSSDVEATTSAPPTDAENDLKTKRKESKEERRARKAARAAHKADKQKRKEERRAAKAAKATQKQAQPNPSSSSSSSSEDDDDDEEEKEQGSQTPLEAASAPTSVPTSGRSTPVSGSIPRRAIRSRYIASKRMASMDPNALKEIFMIKGSA